MSEPVSADYFVLRLNAERVWVWSDARIYARSTDENTRIAQQLLGLPVEPAIKEKP